jgi:hypothetical protein
LRSFFSVLRASRNFLFSLRVTAQDDFEVMHLRKSLHFLTPPVAGADLRAAAVAKALRGALPPVDLRAVCLVLKGSRKIRIMQRAGFVPWDAIHFIQTTKKNHELTVPWQVCVDWNTVATASTLFK